MKLAIYSILTVIAMTGSTYAQNQCGKGTEESQASSSQSTEEDKSEKKDLLTDEES